MAASTATVATRAVAAARGAEWAGIARRCTVVAIDFDETLTVNDTCSVLGGLGARAAPAGVGAARWQSLVHKFSEEYAATVPGLLPAPPLRCWRVDRFQQYVSELRDFDLKCNARLECGALAGIPAEALQRAAAEHVVPQPGAAEVLQQLLAEGSCPGEVRVLSASWSDQFVREALRKHFVHSPPEVTANSLITAVDTVTTGAISWHVASAGDKAGWLRRWPSAAGRVSASDNSGLKVVVGDSIGDLPAMVEAGIGVIVKQSNSLKDAIAAFGLELLPLDRLLAEDRGQLDELISSVAIGEREEGSAPVLLAGGWSEIGELLFGSNWSQR
jgi:phosphoserine phosphatase